jgi:hypothetical protein
MAALQNRISENNLKKRTGELQPSLVIQAVKDHFPDT